MPKLTESQILEKLPSSPEWTRLGDMLVRSWRFASAQRALEFMNRVAEVVQKAGHYPAVEWSFRDVRVELSTHADGGLTDADFDLADTIDRIPVDR